MNEKKSKAYKFVIITSIICIILSGVNYIAIRVPAVGAAFILGLIMFVVIIICYKIEKQSKNKIN